MSTEYTQENLWKILESLPKEIQEAVFSEYTANHIRRIGEKYSLSRDKISTLAEQVGNVFLGLLPLEAFKGIFVSDLGLTKESAEKANREINRFVFFPVKSALEQLYKEEKKEVEVIKPIIRKEGTDRYREAVE